MFYHLHVFGNNMNQIIGTLWGYEGPNVYTLHENANKFQETEMFRVFWFQLSEMNSVVKAEKSDVLSPVMWTSTVNKPEFLVGKEVSASEN